MSPATRDKVLQAARALAYVPSETGRSLSTRTTRRVGVVAADLTNPFYPELVEPLTAALERLGYRALLVTDRGDGPVEVDRLVDGSLDGVILTTTLLGSPLPRELADRKLPVVLVNREAGGSVVDACVADNKRGAGAVADLLADLGHRRIGAIFGPSDTSTGRDRELGLLEGLNDRRLSLPRELTRRGPFTYESGRDGLHELLDVSDPPTAILCANDVVAMGACSAAKARGVKLPEELTIVGFDDIAMASWEVFDLTTVRCDLGVMAETAVQLLASRIQDPARPIERVVLSPSLVLRGTHAVPR